MGVLFSFLNFFDIVHKQQGFFDPVIALGSLNINDPVEAIRDFASKNPWWKHDETYSLRSLLRDRYQISDYRDVDINGAADIWLDLNKPLDPAYENCANVVLNGGTLEHVFDVAQALKNIHSLLRSGGTIIHLVPVSWYNHGYYNFNPALFKEIAAANDYHLLAEGFHCSPEALTRVQGVPARQANQGQPAAAVITFDGKYTEENERILNSFNKIVFPSNLLYMVAYRKNNANDFVYPVDIQYDQPALTAGPSLESTGQTAREPSQIKRTPSADRLNDLEYIPCPLCGVDDTKLLFKRKDTRYPMSDMEFSVVRCRHCGFVYVNPRPNEADIHQFYPDDFYSTSSSPEQTILEKSKSLLGKYEIVKHIQPGTLLDIGCSKGEFMYMMQNKGWMVKGLEFSSKPPNLFNLDIFYGDLADAPFEKESFDLVTLWAVLEHVYDPKRMLKSINRIIKPGGKLVILVTNFNSIPGRYLRHDDVPRHTSLFTKKTITDMLRRTGYEPEKFTFGQNIFGGSVRGTLNYMVKLFAGEKVEEIVAENQSFHRWQEFSSQIKGKSSRLMERIDALDRAVSPIADPVLDQLHLGFIMTVVASKKDGRDTYDPSKAVLLKKPFTKGDGFAWQIALPEYVHYSDNMDHPDRSKLILLENGKPLWQQHTLHDEIRTAGRGRYSHWNDYLIFSTTDNSDPNTNGHTYQIVFAQSAD